MSGENSEQIGAKANTVAPQPSSLSALKMLMGEGTQNPGAMPLKNKSI